MCDLFLYLILKNDDDTNATASTAAAAKFHNNKTINKYRKINQAYFENTVPVSFDIIIARSNCIFFQLTSFGLTLKLKLKLG